MFRLRNWRKISSQLFWGKTSWKSRWSLNKFHPAFLKYQNFVAKRVDFFPNQVLFRNWTFPIATLLQQKHPLVTEKQEIVLRAQSKILAHSQSSYYQNSGLRIKTTNICWFVWKSQHKFEAFDWDLAWKNQACSYGDIRVWRDTSLMDTSLPKIIFDKWSYLEF